MAIPALVLPRHGGFWRLGIFRLTSNPMVRTGALPSRVQPMVRDDAGCLPAEAARRVTRHRSAKAFALRVVAVV
jgi:hypothetical protein